MKLIQYIQQKRIQYILSALVFCVWISVFYQKIDVREKLHDRPTGEHVWAQIDRASMALTYYKDKASFWLPRCHQIVGNDEGITAGEFPLIPYSVSKLYEAWGFKEIYHRTLVWGLTLIGFIFSFLLAQRFIRSPFWAAIAAILWIASPNLIYYSISFLPDAPALAFMTIAVYFLCRKEESPSRIDLLLFSIFFTLASLIKVSTVLPVLSIVMAMCISERKKKFGDWKNRIALCIAIIFPLVISASWVLYARHVTEKYHTFTFLMTSAPPKSWAEFKRGWNIFSGLNYNYYIDGFRYFLLISSAIGLIFIRRSNIFLFLSTVFIYISGFIFFIIMFQKSPNHFYYWVPFQIAILFNLAWLADLYLKLKLPFWTHALLGIGMMIFINYNAIHVGKNANARWLDSAPVLSKYNKLEPSLDSLGITYENSRVFSFADESFNNSLYLMNRKGIVNSDNDNTQKFMEELRQCNYAIVNDTSIMENIEVKPYFHNLIGKKEGLFIYKIDITNPAKGL